MFDTLSRVSRSILFGATATLLTGAAFIATVPPAYAADPSAPHSGASVSKWVEHVEGRLASRLQTANFTPVRDRDALAFIRLTIDQQGQVQDARIARSSGSDHADQEALRVVRSLSPLPAMPKALAGRPQQVEVQLYVGNRPGTRQAEKVMQAAAEQSGEALADRTSPLADTQS